MSLAFDFDRPDAAAQMSGLNPTEPDQIVRTGVVSFDASYPTGGEPCTAAMLQLGEVQFFHASPKGGKVFEYDYANSKLLVRIGDWNNASDGPFVDTPNATDLATLSTRFYVIGTFDLPNEL